jgi:hypothetical protein
VQRRVMRQFATDEGMGLDLSLSVTSLTLTPGREERGGARGGGVQEDEAAGPAGRHAVEATLVVQHARSPKHAPPPRVRARRSGRRNVGGRDVAPPPAAGRVLDGFAVVEACGVELPELVQSVNLMGKGFTDCEVNDMPHFVELQVSTASGVNTRRLTEIDATTALYWSAGKVPGSFIAHLDAVSSHPARQSSRRSSASLDDAQRRMRFSPAVFPTVAAPAPDSISGQR